MPVMSVTRLRVRSVRYLPAFVWDSFRSIQQLRGSPGFLGGMLASSPACTSRPDGRSYHAMRILALAIAAVSLAGAGVSRPPIDGIAHVAIQTSDLAKARAFYGGLLGYSEKAPRRPHTAIFIVNHRQRLIVRDGLPPSRHERFIDLAF